MGKKVAPGASCLVGLVLLAVISGCHGQGRETADGRDALKSIDINNILAVDFRLRGYTEHGWLPVPKSEWQGILDILVPAREFTYVKPTADSQLGDIRIKTSGKEDIIPFYMSGGGGIRYEFRSKVYLKSANVDLSDKLYLQLEDIVKHRPPVQ